MRDTLISRGKKRLLPHGCRPDKDIDFGDDDDDFGCDDSDNREGTHGGGGADSGHQQSSIARKPSAVSSKDENTRANSDPATSNNMTNANLSDTSLQEKCHVLLSRTGRERLEEVLSTKIYC